MLVEFAIVLPLLILIFSGILYFGRYEDYANQETQLAEEGVRWAAVDNNPSSSGQTLAAYIQSQAQPELQYGSGDVSSPVAVYIYYPNSGTGAVGGPVRVCVVATFQLPFINSSETVAQSATQRIEVAQTSSQWTPSATVPSSCPQT